jgi:phosphoribosylformylglycinamidine cyclo-ligase
MPGLSYADSGVDRELRAQAKKHLKELEDTYSHARGPIVRTPFNTLYPLGNNKYHVKTCDGVGTKVLIAQLANKHDTIGIDGIAMVANDAIRCGAKPLAITDVIDIKGSEPGLLRDILKGLTKGANEAGCPLIGGETADVPELMQALYHINCDCVGEVDGSAIIDGSRIKEGDAVIGMRSSGIHSNGVSLVRRALFKKWGGKYDTFDKPGSLEQELVYETLEPTKIYVRDVFKVFGNFDVHAAVHITGDAYLKFRKLGHGFEFDNFKPHPIFQLIQEAGHVKTDEMFKTFNMGWGFALIVRQEDADDVLQTLNDAEVIGRVTNSGIAVRHGGQRIVLSE